MATVATLEPSFADNAPLRWHQTNRSPLIQENSGGAIRAHGRRSGSKAPAAGVAFILRRRTKMARDQAAQAGCQSTPATHSPARKSYGASPESELVVFNSMRRYRTNALESDVIRQNSPSQNLGAERRRASMSLATARRQRGLSGCAVRRTRTVDFRTTVAEFCYFFTPWRLAPAPDAAGDSGTAQRLRRCQFPNLSFDRG
jgi:hypothetical protein